MDRMRNRDRCKKAIMFLASLIMVGTVTAIFAYVWYEYYADIIVQPFFRKGNWLVIGIYALLLYVLTRMYGGLRIGYLKRGDVIYSASLSLLFVNLLTYFQVSLIGRHFMEAEPFITMTVVDLICIALWGMGGNTLYQRLYPPHQMLLIYGSSTAESLVYKMSQRADKYDICEAVNIEDGLEAVFAKISNYEAIIICDVKAEARNKILKHCFHESKRTYLTPKISDTIVRGADSIHLFDTPLLLCRNKGLSFEQRFIKRAMDLVLALAGLAVLWPFMLLVALAVKVYDGGPILYSQERLTWNGRRFSVYKFRSMIVDAEKEGGTRLASKNDDRITPVGRIIRKLRLDELPQLINIIKGDMSVVGPRPERPEIAAQYEETMPEFSYRLKVKAGLTGYAQVMGKYNTTPYDKLKLDLMYIESYSLFLDIKLILMTIKILFLPGSTEGVTEGARTADLSEQKQENEPLKL